VTKYEELILSVRDSVQRNLFLCQYTSIVTCFKVHSVILQHIRKVRRKFLVSARTRDKIPRTPSHSLVTRQPALCRQHTNMNLNIGKQKWSPWSGPRQPVRPTGHGQATFLNFTCRGTKWKLANISCSCIQRCYQHPKWWKQPNLWSSVVLTEGP